MKKILLLFFLMTISLGYSQGVSQDFEISGLGSIFSSGANPTVTREAGPGTNTTQVIKFVGSTTAADWQGYNVTLAKPVELTPATTRTMSIDVYASGPLFFLVKVNVGSPGAEAAAVVEYTGTNTWQTCNFTFNSVRDGKASEANGIYSGFVVHPYWPSAAAVSFTGANPTARTLYVDNITGPISPQLGAFTVPVKLTTDGPFNLNQPTSLNTLGAFTYTSSNPAVVSSISGTLVTLTGASGTSIITATQAANGIYGASSKTATLTVNPPPQTYDWIGVNNADWAVSTNWSNSVGGTPRTTPATNDILNFPTALGTRTVINVQTQTIGRLVINTGANITFQTQTSGKTLTMSGHAADELSIASGGSLFLSVAGANNNGVPGLTMAFGASSTAAVAGRLEMTNNCGCGVPIKIDTTNCVMTVTGTLAAGGTLDNDPWVTNTTTLIIANGGTFECKYASNGLGRVPTATWQTGSTASIIGTVSVPTITGLGQTFSNLTWNCPNQTNAFNFNGINVTGTLTIANTNSGSLTMANGTINTVNFTQTGGTFQMNTAAGTSTLNVTGTFNQTGGTFQSNNLGTPLLSFNGAATQNVNFHNAAPTGSGLTYRINNPNGINLTGSGTLTTNFNINATGGVRVSSAATAPITTSLALVYAAGSRLTYDGGAGRIATATVFPAANGPLNITVGSGSTLNLNSLDRTVSSLTLNVTSQANSTYGGTGSGAANTTSGFFTAGAGVLTVCTPNTITLTSAVGTDNQTLNTGIAITDITYATTGATGATVAGLPTGVTGAWSGNVVTISGIPTSGVGGTYTVTLTGGCGTVTATGTITLNPTAPTISNFPAITKYLGNASFTLTPNPTSNSAGAWTYSITTGTAATISGNTVTIVSTGAVTIRATQAANGIYSSGFIDAVLTVLATPANPPSGPTAPIDRNAWDVFSVFSDKATYTVVPGTRNYNPGWGQAGAGAVIDLGTGDNVWRASNLNYQGIVFGSNVDVSAMTTFHVDVFTYNETSLQFFQISNTTGERSVALTTPYPALSQNGWVSYDIPLTAWTSQGGFTVDALKEFKIVGTSGKTVYMDNMYFYRAPTTQPPTISTPFTINAVVNPAVLGVTTSFPLTAPSITAPVSNSTGAWTYSIVGGSTVANISGNTVNVTGVGSVVITATQAADPGVYSSITTTATLTVTPPAAPTPIARNTWDVKSFYSGAYTNSASTWGGQVGSDTTLQGNTTRLFTSPFTNGQINFTGNVDVSQMTYVHVDVYSINLSPTWFYLGTKRITLNTPVNGWTSLDILLSDFTSSPTGASISLNSIPLLKFENPNGAVGAPTMYFDNIYFFRDPTDTPPVVGALTVPITKALGDAPFEINYPTTNSSGAWTFNASPATVTFSNYDNILNKVTATIVGPVTGTIIITATQAAVPGEFGPGSASASLVVLPGASPVPPARSPGSVISLYTGTPAVYANAPNYNLGRAFWTGGATLTEVANGTNTALRADNLGFIGLIDEGNPPPTNRETRLNVSAMNNLHLDIYVNQPFANLFFWLLTDGDQRRDITNLQAGWNSIDIPLSQFSGANLANVYGLKFEQNQPGTLQFYIDNIYFNIACYTPTATIVSNGGPFCPGSNATFTVNGTEGSTLNYTITGQAETQQLTLTGVNQTITAVAPSTDVDLHLISVVNASCLTTTSSTTFATGDSSVAIKTEINFNNVDDDCDGSKFNGHDAVVVDITTPDGTLATMQDPIGCSEATNTTPYFEAPQVTYKFKITKTNAPTSVAYVTSSVLGFYFGDASNAAHSSTYNVQATAIVNGEEQPYNGNTVTFTTPDAPTISNPPTQTGPPNVVCAYTIARIDSYIYANNTTTYGANRFEFLVERMNGATVVQTVSVTTTTPYFKLTNIVGIPSTMQVTYGTTYRIKVRYGYAGATSFGSQIYTAYGSECLVTTPSLPVASVPCGTTLASVNAFIYATGFAAGASQFEFKVTRVSTQQPGELAIGTTEETLVRNVANFKLTMLTSLFVGLQKEYKVAVRYTVNTYGSSNVSAWSSLLTPCSFFTPDFPETQVIAAQCGVEGVPSTVSQNVYADGVAGATQYRFRLYNAVDLPYTAEAPYDQSVYSPNNYVKLNQFPGLIAGVDYSVTVVAQLNGEYPNIDLAKDCSITAPQSTPVGPAKAVIASAFQATAYPNPFANNFMINVKSSSQSVVSLKVYDMIGRLIEQRETTVSDLETATIGDRYPSGVYNVVVSQQDDLQTLRVVKR